MKTLLFLTLFIAGSLSAQTIKITKIINTNLFELEDGRTVKMAGLDVPCKDTPGENLQDLVEDILQYEDNMFLNRKLDILPAVQDSSDSTASLVYIIRKYDLGSVEFNERFLELGYGKFLNNVDTLHRDKYLRTEANAIKGEKGLWSFRLPEVNDTLDRKYSLSEFAYYSRLDSLYQIQTLRENASPLEWQITVQTFSGVLIGFLGSVTMGATSGWAFNTGGDFGALGPAILGMTVGYFVSAPLGVYWAANYNNPTLSYWSTLGFSTLSTIAGIGIASLGKQDHYNQLWIIPALMPLISPLIYVNCIASNPVRDGLNKNNESSTDLQDLSGNRSLAYKDIFNRNLQFRINILTILF